MIKQGVKLCDASQQWKVTISELFAKTISACNDNYTEVENYCFEQCKLRAF